MAHFVADLEEDAFLGVEGPCEFCDKMFPLMLLSEHQSGCRPDLLHFSQEDPVRSPSVETKEKPDFMKDKVIREVHTVIDRSAKIDHSLSSITNTAKKSYLSKSKTMHSEVLSRPKTDLEMGISKLMAYGTKKEEEVEEIEKQSFRIPSIPLLNNFDQKKSKIEELFLSDEESEETLEEFWKRADVALNQRKMENAVIHNFKKYHL